MKYRGMPIAVRSGGYGWRTRRNLLMRAGGMAATVLLLVVALLNIEDEPGGAVATIVFALLVFVLAIPARRPRRRPVISADDAGESVVAIPMRPIPLRLSLGLSIVGLLVLIGAIAGAWHTMPDDAVKATATALFGGLVGLVIGGLGAANLRSAARNPRPTLLYDDGLSWVFGGERQWARWDEIASVEPHWTPVGVGIIRVATNHILLTGHDGEPVTAFRTALLDVDPAAALEAIREARASARTTD